MTAPERVQLSRRAGWRLPENTVNVARPGKWGNPFPIGKHDPWGHIAADRSEAVELFRQMMKNPRLKAEASYPDDVSELRGKNLACWCSLDGPCHADVLIDLANGEQP